LLLLLLLLLLLGEPVKPHSPTDELLREASAVADRAAVQPQGALVLVTSLTRTSCCCQLQLGYASRPSPGPV
jgi:hypothetical protein